MGPECLAEALHVSSPVCGSLKSHLIIPLWGKCCDHMCARVCALPCAHVGKCPFMCVEVKGHLISVLQVPPTLLSFEAEPGLASLHRQGWRGREPQGPLLCLHCTGLHTAAFFFWRLTLGPCALDDKVL